MFFAFREATPKNDIPQRGRNSKTSLLSSEVMLVVVLLQTMEPSQFVICSINMVQRIVRHIIAHVADEEEAPKDGKANGV